MYTKLPGSRLINLPAAFLFCFSILWATSLSSGAVYQDEKLTETQSALTATHSSKAKSSESTLSEELKKERQKLWNEFQQSQTPIQGTCPEIGASKARIERTFPGEKFILLSPAEQTYFSFLCNHWDVLLDTLRYQPHFIRAYIGATYSGNDTLFTHLSHALQAQQNSIEANLRQSSLTEMEQRFLLLILRYTIARMSYNPAAHHDVQTNVTLFLKDFPEAPYREYIANNIRVQIQRSLMGFGLEFSLGYALPTGQSTENIKRPAYFNFSAEWLIADSWIRGNVGIGFQDVENEFQYKNSMWRSGDDAEYVIADLQLGYTLLEKRKRSLGMFFGYGLDGFMNRSLQKRIEDSLGTSQNSTPVEVELLAPYWSIGFRLFNHLGEPTLSSDNSYIPSALYYGIELGYRHSESIAPSSYRENGVVFLHVSLGLRGRSLKRTGIE